MYSRRNYPLLLAGQFLGAFGDNALLAVIVGQLTFLQQSGTLTPEGLRLASAIYTSLLFVPYVLLAPIAGYLNDRFSKTAWLAGGNALKLGGALLCAAFAASSPLAVGVGYFIVGIGACFYGPAKYGILPEILPREKLVGANGLVELLTLLAILSGAIVGAKLSDVFHAQPLTALLIVAGFFAAALGCSVLMRRTPAQPQVRFAQSISAFVSHLRALVSGGAAPAAGAAATAPRRLGKILLGTALFWVCGAAMKINFQAWGLQVLGLTNNTDIALLGLWLSAGVMLGSVLAGKLHAVSDLRATRAYGAGLAGTLAVLFTVRPHGFWTRSWLHLGTIAAPWPIVVALVVTGAVAGLFLIPLNAALQAESDPEKLGKTIAVQNLFDNLGMCTAGAYLLVATKLGLSPSGVFLGLAFGVAAALLALRLGKLVHRRIAYTDLAPTDGTATSVRAEIE